MGLHFYNSYLLYKFIGELKDLQDLFQDVL